MLDRFACYPDAEIDTTPCKARGPMNVRVLPNVVCVTPDPGLTVEPKVATSDHVHIALTGIEKVRASHFPTSES